MIKDQQQSQITSNLGFEVVHGTILFDVPPQKITIEVKNSKELIQKQSFEKSLANEKQETKNKELKQQNKNRKKVGTKETCERFVKKIELLMERDGKWELFGKIKQCIMGNQKSMNLQKLNEFYQNKQLRPLIKKYLWTGRYRREIIRSKKRFAITQEQETNSARNLLKSFMFDAFAFIQGGSENKSYLNKSIYDKNMIYQNSMSQVNRAENYPMKEQQLTPVDQNSGQQDPQIYLQRDMINQI